MSPEKPDKEKNPVAYARERNRERGRNWRPSPELDEATREKKSVQPSETDKVEEIPKRKIARPKSREDMDL
ncbi:hypothetical protein WDW37_18665 [Bdellovibrionota bacterium FG-1]